MTEQEVQSQVSAVRELPLRVVAVTAVVTALVTLAIVALIWLSQPIAVPLN